MARKSPKRTPVAPPLTVAPPYPPSWINRFADWVDRLPGASAAYYVGAALLLAGLQWSIQMTGSRSADSFNLLVAITIPYELGLMHYLLRTSAGSLEEFRPALRASAHEAEDLRYRLTVLPSRPALWAAAGVTVVSSGFVAISYLLDRAGLASWLPGGFAFPDFPAVFHIAPTVPSVGLTALILIGAWWATGTYAYLMFHQLRTISLIYSRHTEIRVFRLGPLYAFSRHTLRSALGLLLLAYGLFAVAPEVILSPLGQGSWLLLITGAVATFLFPLWGIHRHLVREKEYMLHEAGRRMEAGVAELHRRMDQNELARMDDLNKALASLEIERAALERVPSWPWERGTLRSLVAALVLPIVIWLVQQVLQPLLSR